MKSIAIQCQPQVRSRVDQTTVKHANQYTQVIVKYSITVVYTVVNYINYNVTPNVTNYSTLKKFI